MIRLRILVQLFEMLLQICFGLVRLVFVAEVCFLGPVLFAGLLKVLVLFEKSARFEGFVDGMQRSQSTCGGLCGLAQSFLATKLK